MKEETRALQADKNTKERGVYHNDNARDSSLKKTHTNMWQYHEDKENKNQAFTIRTM